MDECLFTAIEPIEPNGPRVESFIDAAAKSLCSAHAQPERLKVFHNGNIYLDIPMSNGRIICPINVDQGSLKIEIWGKGPNISDRKLFSSSIPIKESVYR